MADNNDVTAQVVSGSSTTPQTNDVTGQVVSGASVSGPVPGATGDAATGGAGGGGTVTLQPGASQASASTATTSGATVTEIPLVDRIATDEAAEKSDAQRIGVLESKYNDLAAAHNTLANTVNSGGGSDIASVAADVAALRKRIYGD